MIKCEPLPECASAAPPLPSPPSPRNPRSYSTHSRAFGITFNGVQWDVLQAAQHWRRVKDGERWGQQWALQALAAADRVQLTLGAHMDTLYSLMQPHAEAFQRACNIDQVTPLLTHKSKLMFFQKPTFKTAGY